jgi:hypothetical protein
MVKIESPTRIRDLEVKAGTIFKALFGIEASKKDLFDNDRMLILNLEKRESIAFLDRDDNVWELSRNAHGRYNLRRLKSSPTVGEIP